MACIRKTHTDPASCKYTAALCVHRTVNTNEAQNLPGGGANFVDVGLKVLVKQETGTLISFDSNYLHGTTQSVGAVNWSYALTFTKRLNNGWVALPEEKQREIIANGGNKGQFVTSAPGAGDNNV
jgi:hypothetical protein